MKLTELKKGEKGVITRINGQGLLRKRLSEMGFIKGKTVEAVRYAPLGSPVVYRTGYCFTDRNNQKRTTFVVKTNCYEA